MQKARIPYEADGEHLVKGQRTFDISSGLVEKIDSIEERAQKNKIDAIVVNGEVVQPNEKKEVELTIPRVEDSDTSRSRTDALSARVGKELSDEIKNLKSLGRFLSVWNATTGLPETNPLGSPYYFRTGDYYMVGTVGETNYKPSGDHYTDGVASTVVETEKIKTSDVYMYDGTTWVLQINSERAIAIDDKLSTTSENPVQNRVITEEVNKKANSDDLADVATSGDYNDLINTLTAGTGIKIENNQIINTNTNAEWGKISGTLSDQTDLQTALNGKINKTDMSTTLASVDNATVPTTKAVKDYVDGSHPYFSLIEGTDYTVEYDDTKGVAPFNASYGYTNVTITKPGVKWIEGAFYFFAVNQYPGTSTYRNVRVRIGTDGEWIGLGTSSSVSAGYAYFQKAYSGTFIYNKKYYDTGALHSSFYDSNTTYAYLVNTYAIGAIKIDDNGYGAYSGLIYATTPAGNPDERRSSLFTARGTGSKNLVTPKSGKFYIDRHPLYLYSGNVAAGGTNTAVVYQDYTGMDIRYSAITNATYCSTTSKLFMYLHNFNEDDMSFEGDKTTGNIFTLNNIATRFPATMEGYVYLYYLGYNTTNRYTLNANFTQEERIWRYEPSTGELKCLEEIDRENFNKKQDVIEDLDNIRAGAKLGETALQSYTETDPVFNASVASGITNTDITNWNNKQNVISDLVAIRDGASKGATALQSYTETDPVFTASPAATIASSDITKWDNKGTYSKPNGGIPKTDLSSDVQTSLGKADTALQSYTETDPVFNASPAKNITSEEIEKWNSSTSANNPTITINAQITGKVGEFTLNQSSDKTITIPLGQANKPGLVAGGNWLTINQTTGKMEAGELTREQYDSANGMTFVGKTTLENRLVSKQDTINDLATIRSGAALGATALQSFTETDPTVPSHVKSIASTDITNWNNKQDTINDLATIRSGAALGATAVQPSQIGNGTVTIKQGGTQIGSFTLNQSGDAEVDISSGLTEVNWGDIKGTLTSQTDLKNALDAKLEDGDVSKAGKSGKYTDLTDTPTIGQGVLTVKKNGTSIATFSANQVGDITADITVPTNTNQLTNGAGFITLSSVPTKVSQLENDSKYVKPSDLADVAISGDFSDLTGTELLQTTSNLVTTLDNADDTHYPSAKAVADAMQEAGYGDMMKSVYDPNNKNTDIYDAQNHYNLDTELSLTSTKAVQNKVITAKINEIELSKSPNVSIIGTPTIVQGNISNFTASNYLIAPFLSSFAGHPFTLHMDIATGNDVTTQQNIIDANYGMAFAISGGKFIIALSTTGTNWDLGQHTGTYTVKTNTYYCVELEWTGTKYILRYSTDKTNFTDDITVNGTVHLSGNTLYLGGYGNVPHSFKGTFNMNEWYFNSGDYTVWKGMDDVGLATRANLSLSNLNTQGEARLKEASMGYFLKEDEDYTVEYDATKGVAPYNTSYGYTNITITNTAITEKLGATYQFSINTKPATSTYRNVRVRFGESGEWYGLGAYNSVSAQYSYFTKAYPCFFVFKESSATTTTAKYFSAVFVNTTYSGMTAAEATTGTSTTNRLISPKVLNDKITERLEGYHDSTKLDAPSGGTVGQVLTKTASGAEWADGVSRAGEVKTQAEYNALTPKSGVIYFIKN